MKIILAVVGLAIACVAAQAAAEIFVAPAGAGGGAGAPVRDARAGARGGAGGAAPSKLTTRTQAGRQRT